MMVVGGWINWKYSQLSPMLVVVGWINWKYNQLSPRLVVGLIGNITNSAPIWVGLGAELGNKDRYSIIRPLETSLATVH